MRGYRLNYRSCPADAQVSQRVERSPTVIPRLATGASLALLWYLTRRGYLTPALTC